MLLKIHSMKLAALNFNLNLKKTRRLEFLEQMEQEMRRTRWQPQSPRAFSSPVRQFFLPQFSISLRFPFFHFGVAAATGKHLAVPRVVDVHVVFGALMGAIGWTSSPDTAAFSAAHPMR